MKIDIYGGAGFIGTNLALYLREEHEITVLDSLICGRHNVQTLVENDIKFIRKDITHHDYNSSSADVVINLACPASPKKYKMWPKDTMLASVTGTINLVEQAERYGFYLIHASSSEIYGKVDHASKIMHEDTRGMVDPIGPRGMYAEGKRASEAIIAQYWRNGGKASIMRIFNTYGPYMNLDDGRVIPTFIRQKIDEEPLTIEGRGYQTRCYMYVSDIISAFELFIYNQPSEVYNIGNPYARCSVDNLAKMIGGVSSEIINIEGRDDEIMDRIPSTERMEKQFGWVPSVTLLNGLERTMEWAISAQSLTSSTKRMDQEPSSSEMTTKN